MFFLASIIILEERKLLFFFLCFFFVRFNHRGMPTYQHINQSYIKKYKVNKNILYFHPFFFFWGGWGRLPENKNNRQIVMALNFTTDKTTKWSHSKKGCEQGCDGRYFHKLIGNWFQIPLPYLGLNIFKMV